MGEGRHGGGLGHQRNKVPGGFAALGTARRTKWRPPVYAGWCSNAAGWWCGVPCGAWLKSNRRMVRVDAAPGARNERRWRGRPVTLRGAEHQETFGRLFVAGVVGTTPPAVGRISVLRGVAGCPRREGRAARSRLGGRCFSHAKHYSPETCFQTFPNFKSSARHHRSSTQSPGCDKPRSARERCA